MTAKTSNFISRGMPREMAREYIEDFRDRFGNAHYLFAQHAAFPLALTPDLLYQLRERFQRTIHNKQLNIPWFAIADLLLSPLCEEADIGYELYEMDVSIRALLLEDLQENSDFGSFRIEELANFLSSYVEKELKGSDPTTLDIAQSQRWTALAYLKPDEAAQKLAAQITTMYTSGTLDKVRIASILETMSVLNTPLSTLQGFQPLLTYAQIQARSFLGRKQTEDAPARIEQATVDVAQSLGIRLPLERRETGNGHLNTAQQEPNTTSDFYISHHIADHEWAEWIAQQLQDASYSVKWGFEFGPASSLNIDTTFIRTQARYTIALLSTEYMSIDNVQKEWNAILAEGQQQEQRLLLPIRVRECTPQGVFAAIQHLDLVEQTESTARKLLLEFLDQSLGGFAFSPIPQDLDVATLIKPLNLFYCYARKDEEWLLELRNHLQPLQQQGIINTWYDRHIHVGTEWEQEIRQHLNTAQIVLLLVSVDFLNSDYAYDKEMQRALERHESGEAHVVPILIKPVDWRGAPFDKLQMLPSNGQPVSRWANRDEAFEDIIRGLRKIIDELNIQNLERKARVNQDAATYFELGKLYERLKRIEEAIRVYEEARSLEPKNENVLFALSRLYNDTDAYEQAIEILNQLIALQPEFADAYKLRGWVYRRQADAEFAERGDGERRTEEYKLAIADFERAVELRPDFEDALGSLGGLYRRLGDVERAAEYYQRLHGVNPNSSYGLGNLASLSWYLGNVEDARTYFTQLEGVAQARIKEEREDGYWDYYDLALAQLATRKLTEARETYAKAIEETPAVAQLDAVLSNLYFLQRARAHIEGLEEIIAMIENAKDVKGEGV